MCIGFGGTNERLTAAPKTASFLLYKLPSIKKLIDDIQIGNYFKTNNVVDVNNV